MYLSERRPKANLTFHAEPFLAHASVALLAISLVALAPSTSAQQLEPRTYSNAPVGLNFAVAGYTYTTGGVVTEPSIQIENSDVQSHAAVFGYARALDVWGMSGKFDVILQHAWASGSGELNGQFHERDVSGFGDPQFGFSVNFYGAPALSLEEFADYRQDLIIGARLEAVAGALTTCPRTEQGSKGHPGDYRPVSQGMYNAERRLCVGDSDHLLRMCP